MNRLVEQGRSDDGATYAWQGACPDMALSTSSYVPPLSGQTVNPPVVPSLRDQSRVTLLLLAPHFRRNAGLVRSMVATASSELRDEGRGLSKHRRTCAGHLFSRIHFALRSTSLRLVRGAFTDPSHLRGKSGDRYEQAATES